VHLAGLQKHNQTFLNYHKNRAVLLVKMTIKITVRMTLVVVVVAAAAVVVTWRKC
jgi:hypothetical protein